MSRTTRSYHGHYRYPKKASSSPLQQLLSRLVESSVPAGHCDAEAVAQAESLGYAESKRSSTGYVWTITELGRAFVGELPAYQGTDVAAVAGVRRPLGNDRSKHGWAEKYLAQANMDDFTNTDNGKSASRRPRELRQSPPGPPGEAMADKSRAGRARACSSTGGNSKEVTR